MDKKKIYLIRVAFGAMFLGVGVYQIISASFSWSTAVFLTAGAAFLISAILVKIK